MYADYVITESGGFQMPVADGAAAPGAGRGEGHVLVEAPGARHAGPRLAAVPHRQRARHRGRGRAPDRDVPARQRRSTTSWRRFVEGMDYPPEIARRVPRPRRRSRDALARAAARDGPPRARVHAHDVRAHGRARRHQDERDPRPRRARGRHPHAAGPDRRRRARHARARRSATSPTRSRSSRTTTPPPRRRSTRRCGTRSAACRAALVKDSALVPFLMVGGTDNRFFRRAGSVGYGFGLFCRAAVVRGLRHDVPRQRRARRPGVARPVRSSCGRRSRRSCSRERAAMRVLERRAGCGTPSDKDAMARARSPTTSSYEDPPGTVASRGGR